MPDATDVQAIDRNCQRLQNQSQQTIAALSMLSQKLQTAVGDAIAYGRGARCSRMDEEQSVAGQCECRLGHQPAVSVPGR
jgi:hypothetical protein